MADSMPSKPRVVRSHDVHLDAEYFDWIRDVKQRYRGAQIKAAVKVNSQQLLFNWELGRDLVNKKVEETWGNGVVEQVSLDLQRAFPDARGFSARNLWYMKKWYLFYAKDSGSRRCLNELNAALHLDTVKLHQVGAEINEDVFGTNPNQSETDTPFPAAFGFVPWRHHIEIITKCSTMDEALFYVRKTIERGLSRSALVNCMDADLYHSEGNASTNFTQQLPAVQGRLAQEIVKDAYDFGFVSLPPEYNEQDLESALEQNITRFLLELGSGFAFVGRQVEIIVSGKTRRIDMLFYHIRLRCYVVLELKAKSFEPEYVGKLNFYVNAVDELIRTPEENPTLGLLICKDKDRTEVQWAFKGIDTPMGVATYDNVRAEELQRLLPSEEQIRQRLEAAEREFMEEGHHGT